MIHRIDRVNPDVDDRVIKPNEARMARNLRFGASVEDTNLSGGTLYLGNRELPFVPPAGENKAVGVLSDFDNEYIFFALWNGNGFHGIYRINSAKDDTVELVIGKKDNGQTGFDLGFDGTDNFNVSLAYVNGLLYWTDNKNEPRVVDVDKGILSFNGGTGDVYTNIQEPLNYAQAKRPPAIPLNVYRLYPKDGGWEVRNPNAFSLTEASLVYNRRPRGRQVVFDVIKSPEEPNGYQFTYYYVYDNNEESRLAPWTKPCFFGEKIILQIPEYETNNYLTKFSIISKVVFVFRENNDGVPCIIKTVENKAASYNTLSTLPNDFTDGKTVAGTNSNNNYTTINFGINDIFQLPKIAVDTSITNALFDSVPLKSVTNTIVQNRLVHGNFTQDYPNWTGLTLGLKTELLPYDNTSTTEQVLSDTNPLNKQLFRPGSTYTFGIELLDEFGRRIGVVSQKSITIPNPRIAQSNIRKNIKDQVGAYPILLLDDYVYNRYIVKYTVTGSFPNWAKSFRVVNTGAQEVNYFMRGLGNMFYWYKGQSNNALVITSPWYPNNDTSKQFKLLPTVYDTSVNPRVSYKKEGMLVENLGLPINFSQEDNLYLRVAKEWADIDGPVGGRLTQTQTAVEMVEYKIKEYYANCWAVEDADYSPSIRNYDAGIDDSTGVFYQLFYNVEVYSKKKSVDYTFYQNSQVFVIQNQTIDTPITGIGVGDCYIIGSKKTYSSINSACSIVLGRATDTNQNYIIQNKNYYWPPVDGTDKLGIPVTFLAMNPSDTYSYNWVWDKGQENIVDENQKQKELKTSLIFSDPIIGQTDINGLSKFNSADTRTTPNENGDISSLITTNATQREPGVMLAIGTNGVSSFYYDAIQLTNLDGSSNVTTTNAFLASQRPLLGQFGTSRPMSISKTPLSTIYWWSDVVNDLVRYTNAGLERLGLTFGFSNYLRNKYGDNDLITTWYDQVTDEICLVGKTIPTSVFSERYKTFQGERDYLLGTISPERSIGVATKFYNIIGGRIWVTNIKDDGTPQNSIFGALKDPEIKIVTNEQPAVSKRWNQIKVFGPRPKATELVTGGNGSGGDVGVLNSAISFGWWIERKGVWEAAIRTAKDSNGNYLAGKIMESRIIYSTFAFDPANFDKINFIEVKSNASIVQ